MSFGNELLKGATVSVRTGLGSVDIDLEDKGGPPNPILAFLKPEVTIKRGDLVLAKIAPYGEPDPNLFIGVGLLLASVVVLWLVLK